MEINEFSPHVGMEDGQRAQTSDQTNNELKLEYEFVEFTESNEDNETSETVNIKLSMPLNGRRKFKGILVGIENDTLIVEVDGIDYELIINNVDKANLVAKF